MFSRRYDDMFQFSSVSTVIEGMIGDRSCSNRNSHIRAATAGGAAAVHPRYRRKTIYDSGNDDDSVSCKNT